MNKVDECIVTLKIPAEMARASEIVMYDPEEPDFGLAATLALSSALVTALGMMDCCLVRLDLMLANVFVDIRLGVESELNGRINAAHGNLIRACEELVDAYDEFDAALQT